MGSAGVVLSATVVCEAAAQVADAPDCRSDPLFAARRVAVAEVPPCFPPVSTVRRWFYLWRDNGLWQTLNQYLLMALRETNGREASPSAGVIGSQSVDVNNGTLGRQFDVEAPDRVRVTDIIYIRTLGGFAYLAVVIDLYSRRVVGWSMQSRQTTDVVLQPLLMAVWRRKPTGKVLIHSDQGSQFTSMDWASVLRHHNPEHSMSRRGNCHDNAVVDSFFNLLKRERIRRRTYKTWVEVRRDVFDYIKMFYNPMYKHVRNGMRLPVEFERQQNVNTERCLENQGLFGS